MRPALQNFMPPSMSGRSNSCNLAVVPVCKEAYQQGLERVELDAHASNMAAIQL